MKFFHLPFYRLGLPRASRYLVAFLFCAGLAADTALFANPVNPVVQHGAATFSNSGSISTIHQGSDRVIVHWDSFSIAAGETTRFVQPGVNSAALNRVVTGAPSAIHGSLQANGQVYLINPNGILIGPGGRVDTAGFLASTLDVSDADFLAGGDMTFSGNSRARVTNLGTVTAIDGGDIFLIAKEVINHGTLTAEGGTVGLAGGTRVLVRAEGMDERISILPGSEDGSVTNGTAGQVQAAVAELKAAGGNEYALAVNNDGLVRATGFQRRGGKVYLGSGGGRVSNRGRVEAREVKIEAPEAPVINEGTIEADESIEIEAGMIDLTGGNGVLLLRDGGNISLSATESLRINDAIHADNAAGLGGTIRLTAPEVIVGDGAEITANGSTGGGQILIGGGRAGQDASIANAENTTVEAGSLITANATVGGNGDGGEVVLWADGSQEFRGAIEARGDGAGAGGFVEVSGLETLSFLGSVDTGGGDLLLDPFNYTIGATEAANIVAALGSNNVTVETTADNPAFGSSGNNTDLGDITVNSAISWTSGNSLTLNADNDIAVNADIQSGGGGAITFDAINLFFNAGSTVSTVGMGEIAATAFRAAEINGVLQTEAGDITVLANQTGTAGGNGFDGVGITGTVRTADGDIDIAGTSSVVSRPVSPSNPAGLLMSSTGVVEATGTGSIELFGLANYNRAFGIDIDGRIETDSGALTITTTDDISGAATIRSRTGAIRLDASGDGNGATTNLFLNGSTIETESGMIDLISDGDNGGSGGAISLSNATVRSTGTTSPVGAITINGRNRNTTDGVRVVSSNISSAAGDITILGEITAATPRPGDKGVRILASSIEAKNGTIDIFGRTTGTDGVEIGSPNPTLPATLTAGDLSIRSDSDILLDDSVTVNVTPGDVTLLSEGNITLNSSIQLNSNGNINLVAGWDGTTAFDAATFLAEDVNAPAALYGNNDGTVRIGDGTQITGVAVGSRSGMTQAFGHDVNILAGNGAGDNRFAQLGFQVTDGIAQDGTDLDPTAAGGANVVVDGGITVRAKNDLTAMGGDTGSFTYAQLGHVGADVIIDPAIEAVATAMIEVATGRDISFQGGDGAFAYAQLGQGGLAAYGNHSGTTTITRANDITFTGGDGGAAYAQLGQGGLFADGNHSGTTTIIHANDISIQGGNGQPAYAQLGQGGFGADGNHSGTTTITRANNMTVEGGSVNRAYAQLGQGGFFANGNHSGVIDVTLSGDLTLTGLDTLSRYAQIGHGDQPGDGDSGNTVQDDITVRVGGNASLTNAFLGHQIDPDGIYTGGNTFLGVAGDLTADALSQLTSAPNSSGGELRIYLGGSDNVNAATLLNGAAHGAGPFPNDQGEFAFGAGPYNPGVGNNPVDPGEFNYYQLSDIFNYTVGASEAAAIVTALGAGDVALDFKLGQFDFGAEYDWDGGTQFITVNSDISFAANQQLDLLTTGDIAVNADIQSGGGGAITLDSNNVFFNAGSTVSTTGAGEISATAFRAAEINGVLQTEAGDITVLANQTGTAGGNGFDGVGITGTVRTVDGDIDIAGTSSLVLRPVSPSNPGGLRMSSTGVVEATGTGSIELSGLANYGLAFGIEIDGRIETDSGALTITTADDISGRATIHSRTGAIRLDASGDGNGNGTGLNLLSTTIETESGTIDLISDGDAAGGGVAILLSSATVRSTGTTGPVGAITIDGRSRIRDGVRLLTSDISSAAGDITILGEITAATPRPDDKGVRIVGSSIDAGNGTIDIFGRTTGTDGVEIWSPNPTLPATLTAGDLSIRSDSDILLGDLVTVNVTPGDVTLLSEGNITLNSSIQLNSSGNVNLVAGWDGTTAFDAATFLAEDVNAPAALYGNNAGTIRIGDGTQIAGVAVGSRSGTTQAFGHDVNILAGNGAGDNRFAQLGFQVTDGIAQDGTDLDPTATDGANVVVDGGITVRAKNDLTAMGGDTGGLTYAQLGHVGADVTFGTAIEAMATAMIEVSTGRDITFEGGAGEFAYAQLGQGGFVALGNHSGTTTITRANDISFQGGDGQAAYAQLGQGGFFANGSHSGTTTITNANDITFSGGVGERAYAQLGQGGDVALGNHSGTTTITRANDISLQGGSDSRAYAQLGQGGFGADGNHSGTTTITRANDMTFAGGGGREAYAQLGQGGAFADGNHSGVIDVTLSGDLTLKGQDTNDQYAQIGHGDHPGDGDNGNTVQDDITVRVGGDATLSNAFLGHQIDPDGTYTGGNTFLGVAGDLTADALSQLTSAPDSSGGELRIYLGGSDNVNAATLLNSTAHGAGPFPNDQGMHGFGTGPYTADPATNGNFAYYGIEQDIFNYTVGASEAAAIAAALGGSDVALDFKLGQFDFGAEYDWDGGTQFITVNSDISFAANQQLDLLTTGDIAVNADIQSGGGGAIALDSNNVFFNAGSTVSTTGAGEISATAFRAAEINGVLQTEAGDITVLANQTGTAGGDGFDGVGIAGTVRTADGDIDIAGTSSVILRPFPASPLNPVGLRMRSSGVVEATGTGSIELSGLANYQNASGIEIDGRIETDSGGLSMTTADNILGDATIRSRTGAIRLDASGDGNGSRTGLNLRMTIETESGTIDLISDGDNGGLASAIGLSQTTVRSTGSTGPVGAITIDGRSRAEQDGVTIQLSDISSAAGDIAILGEITAATPGPSDKGVQIRGATIAAENGTIDIFGRTTGTDGVEIEGLNSAFPATLTANDLSIRSDSDILLGDLVNVSVTPGDVTLLSEGNITLNSSIQLNSNGNVNLVAGWDGTTAFDAATFLAEDVNAPAALYGNSAGTIRIGDGTQITGVAVGSRSGMTQAFGHDVTLQGSNTTDEAFAQLGFQVTDGFAQDGTDLGAAPVVDGGIAVRAKNNLGAFGGQNEKTYAQIGHVGADFSLDRVVEATTTSDIELAVGQNIVFTGGDGFRSYAQLGQGGSLASGNHSGTTTILAANDLTFTGGGGSSAYAQLGHGGPIGSGNYSGAIMVTDVGEIAFSSGTGSDATVQLGHGGLSAKGNHTGDILIRRAGNVTFAGNLTGSSGSRRTVQLGHGGWNGDGNHSGDITIDEAGDIAFTTAIMTDSFILLGHGGTNAKGNHTGDISLTNVGDISFSVPGSSGSVRYAHLGHGGDAADGNHTGNILITSSGSLDFAAGQTSASYTQLGHGGIGASGIHVGSILLTLDGDLNLTAGSTGNSYAQLGHGGTTANGNRSGTIDITVGGHVTVTAQSTANRYARIGHGDSPGGSDTGEAVSGDILLRIGKDATLTNASIGHQIDPDGTYLSGNTFIGVGEDGSPVGGAGTLTADAASRFNSAPSGELRFYLPEPTSYQVAAGTLLNDTPAPAPGTTPLPNEQGRFAFGTGPYVLTDPGNFAFYSEQILPVTPPPVAPPVEPGFQLPDSLEFFFDSRFIQPAGPLEDYSSILDWWEEFFIGWLESEGGQQFSESLEFLPETGFINTLGSAEVDD